MLRILNFPKSFNTLLKSFIAFMRNRQLYTGYNFSSDELQAIIMHQADQSVNTSESSKHCNSPSENSEYRLNSDLKIIDKSQLNPFSSKNEHEIKMTSCNTNCNMYNSIRSRDNERHKHSLQKKSVACNIDDCLLPDTNFWKNWPLNRELMRLSTDPKIIDKSQLNFSPSKAEHEMAINLISNMSNSRRSEEDKGLMRCLENNCNFETYNIDEYVLHKINVTHSLLWPLENSEYGLNSDLKIIDESQLNSPSPSRSSSPSEIEYESKMAINPNSNTSNSRRSTENKVLKRCENNNCNFETYDSNKYWMHKHIFCLPSKNSEYRLNSDLKIIDESQLNSPSPSSPSETEHESKMAINPNSNTSNSRRLTENKRLKRCKEQDCNFVTHNITEYWMHKANAHRLSYPYVCRYDHCKFVTKYKHHMKHHQLSKHENVKLYKCDYKDCTYDCVTKSMLASHQKSHWDYYPYQCGSCIYKTKFLNIYKKHLRDNNHKHGMALNKYGVPDPTIVIDIYGTRRGPRQTATATSTHEQNQDCNEQSQAVDKNTAYSNSNILTQYYSWVSDFGLLCAQKVNKLLESYHANTNLGQLQRRSAIDINCESNTSATLTTMQNHYIRYASVMYDMLRQQYYNAFPQNQEKACVSTIGPLDTPLDLRVSEASRRK